MAAVILLSAVLLLVHRSKAGGSSLQLEESLIDADEMKQSDRSALASPEVTSSSFLMCFVYFFAAWGDRMWEFSSVVFMLNLFPNTLLPPSLFGLLETIAGILGSSAIGRFIDSSDRLTAVRTSIVVQNTAICGASILYYFALINNWATDTLWGVFSALVVCACFAKWASSLNKISIHKDWCVVICAGDSILQAKLNANMRRVDLVCSIVAPLVVGVLATASTSAIACLFIAGWSSVSLFVEYFISNRVYFKIPQLAAKKSKNPKKSANVEVPNKTVHTHAQNIDGAHAQEHADNVDGPPPSIVSILRAYVAHPVFLASLAYCFLYVSVLSFGGIMIAFLKANGLNDAWLAVGCPCR